jgi:hypothetical protein
MTKLLFPVFISIDRSVYWVAYPAFSICVCILKVLYRGPPEQLSATTWYTVPLKWRKKLAFVTPTSSCNANIANVDMLINNEISLAFCN